MAVSAFAPASIGNFTVGYDLLGVALEPLNNAVLGDRVFVDAASSDHLSCSGRFAFMLPDDAVNNVVLKGLERFSSALRLRNIEPQPHKIHLQKNLPLASGTGSSAASIVATFVALNEVYQQPFSPVELLQMMGEIEATVSGSLHYDNLAPSFFGGMQLMKAAIEPKSLALPTPFDWHFILVYSGQDMMTRQAREILPVDYPQTDSIKQAQNLALFVDGLYRADESQVLSSLKDYLAEPYREGLLNNYQECKHQWQLAGAKHVGISGSGPTAFIIVDGQNRSVVEHILEIAQTDYISNEKGFAVECRVNPNGVKIEPHAVL